MLKFLLITILLINTIPIDETFIRTRSKMEDSIVNGIPFVYDYNNVWARDTLFSCYGFISDGQYDVVRDLLYYLWNGRYTSNRGDSIRYITDSETPLRGEDESIDSTPLWIIIADEYSKTTEDQDFEQFLLNEKCYEKLEKWMDSRIDNGLVNQHGKNGYYYDWSDSARRGLEPKHVMYSNILFWKAYSVINSQKALNLKENIEKDFWNGHYYRDFLGDEYLSADGNLLAIVWDFSNRNQSLSILNNMEDMIFPIPTTTVKPKYPHDLTNYQNGRAWGWLGSLSIIAYLKIGDFTNANKVYSLLISILKNERWRFSELYTHQGAPDGAPCFIWYSGLFMYALHLLNTSLAIPIIPDLHNITYLVGLTWILYFFIRSSYLHFLKITAHIP